MLRRAKPFPVSFLNLVHSTHIYLPMKMEQSVPKRRHIKSRRRVITQKKAYGYRIASDKLQLFKAETKHKSKVYLNIHYFFSYNSFRIPRYGIYLRSICVADGTELSWAVTKTLL